MVEKILGLYMNFHIGNWNNILRDHISVHEVGMQDILRIRAIQENPLEDAIVIGVEPESLEIGFEPSAAVQQALPEVKARVLSVLRGWGIQIEPK